MNKVLPETQPSRKMLEITRTVFRFGILGRTPYGNMCFSPDGGIRVYQNARERRFTYEDGTLSIFSDDGVCTSDFVESKHSKLVFTPLTTGHHALEPVFSLGSIDAPKDPSNRPAVFVNTMAKAGTYFVAQALHEMGYNALDLHLSSQYFHDNRGVPNDEIHWNPNSRRVACDAAAIAALIRPGEFMVGHVDDLEQLNMIRAMGVEIVTVVRHPYDQIASMLAFKEKKTKPKPQDKIWQSMSGIDRFKSFLLVHDTSYWLAFSITATKHFPFFRFEDLLIGAIPDIALSPRLLSDLRIGIVKTNGKETSTLMRGKREDMREFFKDPVVKTYFDECGLTEFAEQYWPESFEH